MKRIFDPEAYEIADAPGKQAVAQHLLAEGRAVQIIPENYWYDLLEIVPPDSTVYHEVEVRSDWYGNPWRFKDIAIPDRKRRLIHNLEIRPLFFWCVSPDLCQAYWVDAGHVDDSILMTRWVQQAGKTMGFYAVPVELWQHVNLTGGQNK